MRQWIKSATVASILFLIPQFLLASLDFGMDDLNLDFSPIKSATSLAQKEPGQKDLPCDLSPIKNAGDEFKQDLDDYDNSFLFTGDIFSDNQAKSQKKVQVAPFFLNIKPVDDDLRKKYDEVQVRYIQVANAFIDEISKRSLRLDKLSQSYWTWTTSDLSKSSVVTLLTEEHSRLDVMVDNFSYIEGNIKRGDIVLNEGGPAKFELESVLVFIINRLVSTYEFFEAEQEYNISKIGQYYLSATKTGITVQADVNYKKLKLNDSEIVCSFWDVVDLYPINSETRLIRNQSMAESITHFLKKGSVFVIAGAAHTPQFDYTEAVQKGFKTDQPFLPGLEKAYEKYPLLMETEEIFKALKNESAVLLFHKDIENADLLP